MHKYAYNFDFDVMHPFMLRSFAPFFRPGSLLELGSFKGDFTKRLTAHFTDITCVEASGAAVAEAKAALGDRVTFVQSTFETATLNRRFDNIVLTHVLEHLDDPVGVLARVNREWLADGGRLFLVCPNANAASRQIAVRMGIISHHAAVTPAERGARAPDHLCAGHAGAGRQGGRPHRGASLRDLLQGARQLPMGPPADHRHRLARVPRGLLSAGSGLPGPLFEHFPDVRSGRPLGGMRV